ncbi:MAG: HepT-like ribonuclease domain-containing protein [Candidatus Bathyarchaeia archaeon]
MDSASTLQRLREALSNDPNVLLAYLFGSLARGARTALSDVDVAVILKEGGFEETLDIQRRVAEAGGVSEDRVDIIDLSRAPTSLKYTVLKDGEKVLDRGDYGEELTREVISRYPEVHFLTIDSLRELTHSQDPMAISPDLIHRRVAMLKGEIRYLEERVLATPLNEVVGDDDVRRAFERAFEVSVGAMLDICKHAVTALGLGVAETYSDHIRNLLTRGVIPKELGEKLLKLVRWRNVIVPGYLEIDYEGLYEDAGLLVSEVTPPFIRWALELAVK